MIPSMRLTALLVFILCLQTGAYAGSPNEGRPTEGSPGKPADSLYEMSPSAFFELKRVQAPIDLDDTDHDLLSAAIFHETNRRRMEEGREELGHMSRLDEAAKLHAENMVEHEYVAHVAPKTQELRTPADRVREVGLRIRYLSENIATQYAIQVDPGKPVIAMEEGGGVRFYYEPGGESIPNHTYRSFAQSVVDGWMSSPGHRKNILAERPRFLGAACSVSPDEKEPDQFYCVQLFFDGPDS